MNHVEGFLYNQIEAVLSQYEMKINEVTKGRGTYICNTDMGMKLLVPFSGSNEKGDFLKIFLENLNEHGFPVEQIMKNTNSEVVTEDSITGERFIVKDYIAGTELNTGHFEEMEKVVNLLAAYHNVVKRMELPIPDKILENSSTVVESRRRHYRELVKVKNYIRSRKKKNEFEQIYMKYYEPILATAEESIGILEQQEQKNPVCGICHGDFNQHNAVRVEEQWYMIHFENFNYSWLTVDLANFIRKMLEKSDWDIALGMKLIDIYNEECELGDDGYYQLYGLLLFPEKFWKITNHYINSRKAWISGRDIEKLKKVIEQENMRLKFMENLFSNFK